MSKEKVLIMVDSNADLPEGYKEEKGIVTIPIMVGYNGVNYFDGVDINITKLYEMISSNKYPDAWPSTSSTNVAQFKEFIQPYLDQGYNIVYISLGGNLSATGENFLKATENLRDRCFLVDSGNLSGGIGLNVILCCDLKNQGLSAKEIAEIASKRKDEVSVSFSVKDLEYLHKGGRCSGFARVVGTALRIHPIIRADHSSLYVYKKTFGKYTKALDMMIDDLKQELENDNVYLNHVFVIHAFAEKEADYIMDKIKELGYPIERLSKFPTGTAIFTHCGPRTVGILYRLKKEKVFK